MDREDKRQLEHIAPLVLALLIRWLSTGWLLGLAAVGTLFGVLSVKLDPHTMREQELSRGYSAGKILYGLAVFVMILLLHRFKFIAAGGWALMAAGDGCATLVGRHVPGVQLPWNRHKSLGGLLAFVVCGTAAATFFTWFVNMPLGYDPQPAAFFFWLALPAAIAAGVLESIEFGIDDNIVVPAAACFVLYAAATVDLTNFIFLRPWWQGLLLSGALGGAAWALNLVSSSGFVGGLAVGTLIYMVTGWPGFIVLATFFVLASLCTRHKREIKESLGVAQEAGGRRGTQHAMANCLAGLIFGILALLSQRPELFVFAFVGSFATALFDTSSSELGQVYGKHPVLLPTFRAVTPGTEGAVSLEGTLLGVAGGAIIALEGVILGLIPAWGLWVVILAAFFGSTLESILGSLNLSGQRAGNEALNFLNTLAGGLAAALIAALIS